jgi:integrase
MINHVLDDRRAAKGRHGLVSERTLKYHEEKLAHFARIFGADSLIVDITYDAVGRYIAQRREEGGAAIGTTVSQHTIHKELQDLRLGLRLESARGAYPHNVDHVTRSRRFAVGATKRERYLPWPEIASLIAAFMATESIERAQQVAWHIAVGARMSESEHARKKDHDLTTWRVRVRGTKSKKADAVIPIAPAFRRLLEWSLYKRPEQLFSPWLNFNRALKRACVRAGIERCSSNDLRRTHMTLLSHAGIPNEVLKTISRHTTTRMLDERYVVDDVEVTAKLIESVVWPDDEAQ